MVYRLFEEAVQVKCMSVEEFMVSTFRLIPGWDEMIPNIRKICLEVFGGVLHNFSLKKRYLRAINDVVGSVFFPLIVSMS